MKMNEVVNYIVGGLVVLVLVSVLAPIGLNAIHTANTTGFTTAETTIFSILGTLVLVGVLIGIIYMAIKK
jgi:hypothetical protein